MTYIELLCRGYILLIREVICLIIYLTTCIMFCMINTIICIKIYYKIDYTKYITENKHHDMTVGLVQWLWLFRKENSDKDTPAKVTKKQSFKLRCITTYSLNRVLTADFHKDCIYLLDQNGMFSCCIGNSNL